MLLDHHWHIPYYNRPNADGRTV